MKRKLDQSIVDKWVESVGGPDKAAVLISQKLGCSLSKAQKIVGGWYPSMISDSEQIALAELMDVARDTLCPFVEETTAKRGSQSA